MFWSQELADHFRLVAAVGAALGVPPAVCIATYPKRDHHDKTWWHGGTATADTAKAVDPAAVAANYKVILPLSGCVFFAVFVFCARFRLVGTGLLRR